MDTTDSGTVAHAAESGLPDWRVLAQALHARFRTGDFATGARFVQAVSEVAEEANHHPDVTLRYPHVDLVLVSHDVGHLTERDTALASRISALAAEQGVTADTSVLCQVELALDSADHAAVGPFWSALLTGSPEHLEGPDVVDPHGRVPVLWFQQTDAHPTPRQRFHLDVWVPHDQAQARVEAAVSAGGSVVDDSRAPAFVVLADPEGNRACVCTAAGR